LCRRKIKLPKASVLEESRLALNKNAASRRQEKYDRINIFNYAHVSARCQTTNRISSRAHVLGNEAYRKLYRSLRESNNEMMTSVSRRVTCGDVTSAVQRKTVCPSSTPLEASSSISGG
jgi:hypothetical protein